MNKLRNFFLMLTLIALVFACVGKVDKIGDMDIVVKNIGLYDHNDEFHTIYYYDDAKAIVLYVQGNGCPLVRNGFNELKSIKEEYEKDGFKFLMVNSNTQDDRDEIKQEAIDFSMDIPILIDNQQFLAHNLNITRTTEVIIINPTGWQVIYRGPIDDKLKYEGQKEIAENQYLRNALDAIVESKPIEENFIKSIGCAVTVDPLVKNNEDLTYSDDIAPILQEKCIRCHTPGGIAPWAMTDYETVRGWSSMMREVLLNNRMPPWQADPHYNEFNDDLSLSEGQKKQIVAWIDAGKKRGEGDDILTANVEKEVVFQLGKPDTIITLDKQEIPANGLIDYRYQVIDLSTFGKDIKIEAVEILPGNPEVLHHILGTIRYPEGVQGPVERKRSPWIDGIFMVWAPGMQAEQFPEGTARTLPSNSKLYMQLHYTTNGKATSDVSRIGLYYADKDDHTEYLSLGPADLRLEILPNDKRSEVSVVEKFDRDITLYGFFPHMHFRGKSFKYTLVNPDKTEEILLNVPNYSFNWQRQYYLRNPKKIAAGSMLKVDAIFDNSLQNPFNPNPQDTVRFGLQTKDEMMIGYFNFVFDEKMEL